ncbi:MAG TPA: polyhydroxyalkanoic acid system family protein [Rhodanobacteraceae bacterium]|jgi:putative polyhydroxyalkanoate system protein|nr:polyhydroxyalkanoic acid system family protein [Rhodanobacteraceae bacterium]
MPSIDIERPHSLGRERARAIVEQVAERMQQKFGVDTRWEGDTLHFSRSGVDGTMAVDDAMVRVNARLGLLLAPLKPMIEEEIGRKLDQYLA